jgi:hypothetical protein
MDHGETHTWIPFVKTPYKLLAKLQNRRLPGIYLGPVEDNKGDILESRSAVFFHKLDKSQIAKQVAIITDELNEMFDNYEDVYNRRHVRSKQSRIHRGQR